jgi:tetratricopeptide (TPR) repeat protein
MRTRLSAFCDHFIEASWLLALISVPLFFNIFTNRVFEPDKLTLLRTIASVAAVAWLVRQIESYRRTREGHGGVTLLGFLRRPMMIPVLSVVLAYLVSTAGSIIPPVSLWGSYVRLQGAYTNLSYLVIFALMVQGLRTGSQLRRVLNVMVLVSLPIALYGLVQHSGIDPLPWGGDVTRRVTSNMGNAIFVAAYLIMVLPITAMRWIALQRRALEGLSAATRRMVGAAIWVLWLTQCAAWFALPFGQGVLVCLLALALLVLLGRLLRTPSHRYALLGIYSLTLSAQLAATVYTQSRGPLLGMIAGVFVIGLIYLALARHRKSALAWVALSLATLVALLLMNVPGSPLSFVRDIPYAGRMARLLETEQGTGRVRLLIWEGSVALVRSDPLRAVVGYGPESMHVAYNAFYPPELAHFEARNASPDRAHNETFDALITMGFLGLVSYILVFGSLLYLGLVTVGLVRGPTEQRWFLASLAAGGLLGALLPWVIQESLALSGPGLALGMVGGLAGYTMARVVLHALRGTLDELPTPSWRQLIAIGLLGAIVGHLIEINFGISIAATRTYLWAYAAVLVLVAQQHVAAPEIEPPPSVIATQVRPGSAKRRKTSRQRRAKSRAAFRGVLPGQPVPTRGFSQRYGQVVVSALLVAFTLATMAWDYTTNTRGLTNAVDIVIQSLGSKGGGMALMVAVVFAVMGYTLVAEQVEEEQATRDTTWWLTSLGLVAASAGVTALLYALVHAAKLAPGKSTLGLITEYYGLVALIALALAAQLYLSGEKPVRSAFRWGALAYLLPLVAALVFVNQVNLTPVKADILYKQGLKYDGMGSWDQAIAFYGQASELAPQEDYYQLFLGRVLLEKAKRMADSPEREAQFERALETLERARSLSPLNTDHTSNLARSYRAWAEATTAAERRQERFLRALDYYDQATRLSPNNAELYNEWGLVYALMGDEARALATYEVSLGLDTAFGQTYVLIGDIYFGRQDWPQVIDAYQRALVDDGRAVYTWSRLAYAYSQVGDIEAAIAANLKVLESVPDDYVTLRNLGFLYDQADRPADGLAFVIRALARAPEQDKASLESFRQYLVAKIP